MKTVSIVLLLTILSFVAAQSGLYAGVGKVNATLPIGTPLAGYNHGPRRVPYWPLPEIKPFTSFMTPSTGILTTIWTKALIISNGQEKVVFATLDGIGSDENLNLEAYEIAAGMGFNIPMDNIIFSSSHSHSGPGAVSADMLWALAPATDLLVPELRTQLATYVALALIQAMANLQPVSMDIGSGTLIGVTRNRRANISPYVTAGTIDPHLGIIRIDKKDGTPLATVWNYAMHGTCYGPDNMMFCSEIMGGANDQIEEIIGGVSLFVNADAGDIDPTSATCNNMPKYDGAPIIAAAVKKVRDSLTPSTQVTIQSHSQVIDFGPTNLNITLQRFDNCSSGGPLDICTLCTLLRCDVNAHLYSSWIQQTPRFTAFSFVINDKSSVVVSIPGEALVELGWWIRNDTLALGYDTTLLAGYSNAHMGYFATPDEYDIGGYESQLTLWGIDTAEMVREGCAAAAKAVVPSTKKVAYN